MTKIKVTINEIKDEIDQIRKMYFSLKDDSAFVLWFLRAFLSESEEEVFKSLTGEVSDKGIDAILIDEGAKQVYLIQGKFHHSLGDCVEKRNDIISFVDLSTLPWAKKEVLNSFYSKLSPVVHQRYAELVRRVCNNGYELHLYYITTGRCSKTIRDEVMERVRRNGGPVEIYIFDANSIRTIFKDYIVGAAPAVPSLLLRIASEGSIKTDGVIHRVDSEKQIESWVFSMSSKDVGEMYSKAGIRLFARNVRGYLGQSNEINEAMANTINTEPDNFWYYNNGVTIVCDDVKREIRMGQDVLRVEKPQIINGQQTTRTLNKTSSSRASILVRVIKIPRNDGDDDNYDDLVSSIVRATNWQNAIRPSDLVSNDHIQVYLERELRKRGYQYLRKRQSKSEAKSILGINCLCQISKEEMAQAIAACELDPVYVRKGKEGLFDRYYRDLFSSRSISFYLSRYWLMRQVQTAARGYPPRAYAKWLVLHFAWENISNTIGSDQGEQKFRYVCERSKPSSMEIPIWELFKALDGIFKASLVFYRLHRGKGEEAKDVSTFFQRSKLDKRFIDFWNTSNNPHRKKVDYRLRRFSLALEKIEIPG